MGWMDAVAFAQAPKPEVPVNGVFGKSPAIRNAGAQFLQNRRVPHPALISTEKSWRKSCTLEEWVILRWSRRILSVHFGKSFPWLVCHIGCCCLVMMVEPTKGDCS